MFFFDVKQNRENKNPTQQNSLSIPISKNGKIEMYILQKGTANQRQM
jgi:hypothetical protein